MRRILGLVFCAFCSFAPWEDFHHQRRWDVSELCLVEMDRRYPSKNIMASVSRSSASFQVCLWRSAAWRRGAPERKGPAAGAATPVLLTAAVRPRGPSSSASSTVPTSGWRGPQRRGTCLRPSACCEFNKNLVQLKFKVGTKSIGVAMFLICSTSSAAKNVNDK